MKHGRHAPDVMGVLTFVIMLRCSFIRCIMVCCYFSQKYQLIKSATSAGANYEEAQSASSKSDFKNKVNISLKEMSESKYWLKVLFEITIIYNYHSILDPLIKESKELDKILGSIVKNTQI